MGRPNAKPSSDQTPIIHFSHPHPLHPSDFQTLAPNSNCSACNLNDPAGTVYTCQPCNFTLHIKCYQLPQQIKHSFDQNHALVLQPKPVYPEGLFNCDACGNHGPGFSYHCGPCGFDLHTTCATLPTQFTHSSHHHGLRLHFSAPYPENAFSCDVCKRVGSGTWMYRCDTCEFDAHLTCVARLVPGPARIQETQQTRPFFYQPQHSNFGNQPNVGANHGPPRLQPVVMGQPQGGFAANPSYPYNNLNQPVYGGGPRTADGGGLAEQLAVSAVNGLASGVAQATTEAVLQGFFGAGGGGGGGDFVDGAYSGVDGGCSGGDGSY